MRTSALGAALHVFLSISWASEGTVGHRGWAVTGPGAVAAAFVAVLYRPGGPLTPT